MKLLMENWRQYLTEEQEEIDDVEEGLGPYGAVLGATLAGAAAPAYAGETDTTQDTATTQQVDAEQGPEIDKVSMDADGKFSVTVGTPPGLSPSMVWMVARSNANTAVMKHLASLSGNPEKFVFKGVFTGFRRESSSSDMRTHTYVGKVSL